MVSLALLNLVNMFLGLARATSSLPSITDSASIGTIPPVTLTQITRYSSLEDFFNAIPTILFGLVGVTFLLFFVFSAYQYMVSMGNEEEAKKGKNGMLFSVIGLIIALASVAVINWFLGRL